LMCKFFEREGFGKGIRGAGFGKLGLVC
jgi:hypothetical protein